MQLLKLGFASIIQCVFLSLVFMTSCTKSVIDAPVQEKGKLQLTTEPSTTLSKDGTADIPFEKIVFVPCANNGSGEEVKLTGNSKIVYQISWNDRGSHFIFHENYHGVSGIGLTSNETFTASGKTQGEVSGSWESNHFVRTMVEELKINGQNTKFTVRYNLHITINPDGSVSFKRENETADCKVR